MDAIFQCSMDYMDEPIARFQSYMEKASLQLRVELEEYVESTLNSSSSIFLTEGASSAINKLKRGIALVIQRLKEFIQDTKVNFQKYRKDKKIQKKLEKISKAINASEKLKKLEVKYKDYTPKQKFIKREKKALKLLFRKPGTKKEDIKIFMERYKNSLSDFEKASITIASVLAVKAISTSFIQGVMDGLNESICDAEDFANEYEKEIKVESVSILEAAKTVDDIEDMEDLLSIYVQSFAEISSDDIKTSKQIMKEMDNIIEFLDNECEKYFNELEKGDKTE